MNAPADDHGLNAYYNYRCRCSVCRKAIAEYALDYRSRKRGELVQLPIEEFDALPWHGTRAGYNNNSCRCTACKAAHAEYHRAYYARKRSSQCEKS